MVNKPYITFNINNILQGLQKYYIVTSMHTTTTSTPI